jgi:hypothetical protein
MASDAASAEPAELYDSAMTVPSDSENYSANHAQTLGGLYSIMSELSVDGAEEDISWFAE